MAWTTIVLVSTGELATASVQNTQVLGNLNELRTGGVAIASQAALDFIYASSASQLARLAKGSAFQTPRIKSDLSGYEFGQGFAPRMISATSFETAARFIATADGSGVATFGTDGVGLDTSAIITSSISLAYRPLHAEAAGGILTTTEGVFGFSGQLSRFGTDFKMYAGLGQPVVSGSDITFTADHTGFKITRAASGTCSLYATQADGTTETASAALTTLIADDGFDLCLVRRSGAIDYYWRKEGSAWSAATTLTTNLPDNAVDEIMLFAASDVGVASRSTLQCFSTFYSR